MDDTLKILIVDNGHVLKTGEGILGDRRTRDFCEQCSRHFQTTFFLSLAPLDWDQPRQGVVWNSDLVRVLPVPVRRGRTWIKLISYSMRMPMLCRWVRRTDFLYVFFPGSLALPCVAIARILRKPYGIYLRGELGKGSRLWRWSLSGAEFVIAEGGILRDAASSCCDDVELAAPMCSLLPENAGHQRPRRTAGPWTLLYVGRVQERKGSYDLLEAASMLDAHGVDFQLNLLGRDCMGGLPQAYGHLRDRVHFVGEIHDDAAMRAYYEDADLFCFPSHDEGFPRVLYEAMAFGVPIVATPVGSIPSIMTHGRDCLFVEVGDPVGLAETIERALSDAVLRENLAKEGTATVRPILFRMAEEGHDKQLARKVLSHWGAGVS